MKGRGQAVAGRDVEAGAGSQRGGAPGDGWQRLRGLSWASLPRDHGQVLLCDPGQCFSMLPSPLIMEEGNPLKREGGELGES